MYYNEEFEQSCKKQIIRNTILTTIMLIVSIAAAIVVKKTVSNNWGILVLIIGVLGFSFISGIWVLPVWRYYRFVRDVITGRNRKTSAMLLVAEEKAVYKDNKLYFYEIMVLEDDVERKLLYDENREFPKDLLPGCKYEFTTYESIIISYIKA